MKFFKNGKKIKFKNSKKVVELDPTYEACDPNYSSWSVYSSWYYRKKVFEEIEKSQNKQDDLGTISNSLDYLKEQIRVSLPCIPILNILNVIGYLITKDSLATFEFNFEGLSSLVLSTTIITFFTVVNIYILTTSEKNILAYFKLKRIEKEVKEKLENEKINSEVNEKSEEKEIFKEQKQSLSESNNYSMENYNDIYRYEAYKKYVLETGGNEEFFNLPAIRHIIESIIINGDFRVKMEGRSPIYYKNANEDGTFDICGRLAGPYVTDVYKMEYCNDDNKDHYIVLKHYMNKKYITIDEEMEGISYKYIYINKDGIISDITNEKFIEANISSGLLNNLHKKNLIKNLT